MRLDLAGLHHLNAELRQLIGRQGRLIGKGLHAVGQAPQLTLDRLLVPILADDNLAALGEVGVFLVIEERGQVSIRPAALMLFLAHQVFKEQERAVAAVNLGRGRVKLHGKRVAHRLDANIQVEVVLAGVVRGDAEHTEAATHRVLEGNVVGLLGVGHALNIAAQALHQLGQALVGLFNAANLALRPALLLLVDDLLAHHAQLGELVHRAILAAVTQRHVPLVARHGDKLNVFQRLIVLLGASVLCPAIARAHLGQTVAVSLFASH